MKCITLKYKDETYKINIEKISMIQIRRSYIYVTFANDGCEIHEEECLNYEEVKMILENL